MGPMTVNVASKNSPVNWYFCQLTKPLLLGSLPANRVGFFRGLKDVAPVEAWEAEIILTPVMSDAACTLCGWIVDVNHPVGLLGLQLTGMPLRFFSTSRMSRRSFACPSRLNRRMSLSTMFRKRN